MLKSLLLDTARFPRDIVTSMRVEPGWAMVPQNRELTGRFEERIPAGRSSALGEVAHDEGEAL